MNNTYKINIIPNTSLWMKLGRTKYTIPKALSELIDNSIDNMVDDNVQVDIHFAIEGDYIGVLDNGKGMDIETLARALTIAEHVENTGKIGEHGFGLKSASSYLGKNLTIYTKTADMNSYLKFCYNQNEFLSKNEWTIDYQYISKEELLEETDLSFERGTYVKIGDLNVRLYNGLISTKGENQDGTMIVKFQSIYKKFIEKNILTLNLHVERRRGTIDHIRIEPPVKQNLAFKVSFDFTINNNGKDLNIKGWAGVLDFYDENIKNKKKYTSGFDIISKNKVILQHLHLGYSYHPEKRLVLGEIELENFQTTSDKTDFIRNSDWQALELVLNQYITKATLYLASTAYLNLLYEKVNNEEDFDLNLDFNRVLMRTALNDVSMEEFTNELAPAVLTNKSITINEEVFENSKNDIISYMKAKKANQKTPSLAKDMDTISHNINLETSVDSNTIDYSGLALNQDDNSIVNIEERRAYNQNVAKELQIDDSLNYNITFSHQGLIIKHQLIEENSTNPYDFDVDEKKGIIVIKSNKNAFNCLYASLESYCLLNIANSIIDNALIKASEENELNKEIISTIRDNVLRRFKELSGIFRTCTDISM